MTWRTARRRRVEVVRAPAHRVVQRGGAGGRLRPREVVDELFEKHRVPAAALQDRCGVGGARRVALAEQVPEETLGVLALEPADRHATQRAAHVCERGAGGTRQRAGSRGGEEQVPAARPGYLRERLEEGEAVGVRPLHVLDDDDDAARFAHAPQDFAKRREGFLALDPRFRGVLRGDLVLLAQPAEGRKDLPEPLRVSGGRSAARVASSCPRRLRASASMVASKALYGTRSCSWQRPSSTTSLPVRRRRASSTKRWASALLPTPESPSRKTETDAPLTDRVPRRGELGQLARARRRSIARRLRPRPPSTPSARRSPRPPRDASRDRAPAWPALAPRGSAGRSATSSPGRGEIERRTSAPSPRAPRR